MELKRRIDRQLYTAIILSVLFVAGTFSHDNFSSGNLSMICSENRYFPEDDHKNKIKSVSNEGTKTPISDSLVGVLSRDYVAVEHSVETKWIINGDGTANCPYCKTYTIEDEYTGKPILFKYCHECGRFLNGPGMPHPPTSKGASHERDIQRDKRGT